MKDVFFLLILACAFTIGHGSFEFYADNGIDQTVVYQITTKKERREMQREILSLLGLHHKPKPTSHGIENSAPRYMIDLYKSFVDEENGNFKVDQIKMHDLNLTDYSVSALSDADIIMSFVNHGQQMTHIRHDKDRKFWFDVSEVPAEETIVGAELRLYKEAANIVDGDHDYNITVYKLVQGYDPENKVLIYLDSTTVALSHTGWIKLNVTSAAGEWVVFPDKNLGLYLKIHKKSFTRDIQPRTIGIVGGKGEADKQPFMVAFFKTMQEHHVRHTRAARRKQRTDVSLRDEDGEPLFRGSHSKYGRNSCQKLTLYVSFRQLGWQDWIIAPDGYPAFYCSGECSFPLNAHMNATNHAIVQTLVHLMSPFMVPKPCCAPTKLTTISVLYFDDNSNVILKKYKNMVVKACGCH